MRKKSLILTAMMSLCLVSTSVGVVALASAETGEGTPNLATDATLWTPSWFTNHYGFVNIGENGIVFDEYGTDSAVGAVSLNEGLPYEGKITMTFNSEATDPSAPAGFLKVVFADASGSANGNAMKFWEISDTAEHLALEVKYNAVSLWQYNIGGVSGTHEQQTIASPITNYIDGKDHTITIEYATSETAYDLKLSIDNTVHFEDTIASEALYTNNILTLGGYANAKVTDDLTIKSVQVEAFSEDPAPVIDADNLLGQADAWTVAESDAVVYDATTATAQIGSTGAAALVLNEELPVEAKINMKVALAIEGDAQHAATSKIRILGNETSEVVLSLDDDGNIWLLYIEDGALKASAGDWAPALLSGANNIEITVKPELTNGDEDIYVSVSAGSKLIGLPIANLGLMNGNKLTIVGGAHGTATYSSIKVENLVKEKEESAIVEETITSWTNISAPIVDGVMTLGDTNGAAFATMTQAIPVNSEMQFSFTATDDANCWYYLDIESAARAGMWDEVAEGAARFRITASGSQAGYFTVALNGNGITTTSPALTDLCDGNPQTFKFVTETVEGGLKVTLYRNDVEEFSNVYASDTAVGAAQGFYFSFVATGAQTAAPTISNLKATYEQTVDVTAYNAAVATKNAIYALNAYPTEENAAEVKAAAEALLATLEGYTDEQLEVANNALYAEYVIAQADAQLAIVADKAAAQVVVDAIAALNYETITAENVEQAKADLAAMQAQYAALTDAQKAYVSNYVAVEELEIAINDYELSIPSDEPTDEPAETPDEPTETPDEPAETPDEPAEQPSASNDEAGDKATSFFGCQSVVGGVSVVALGLAVAALLKKKED